MPNRATKTDNAVFDLRNAIEAGEPMDDAVTRLALRWRIKETTLRAAYDIAPKS